MPDNSTLPATGEVIATDDINGIKYQRVKPAWGVDGSAIDVSEQSPLPVSDQGLSLLRRIFLLLKPLGIITGGGSNRLSIDVNNVVGGTIGTVTTVGSITTLTTVGTVSNQTAMGGITAFDLMKAMSRSAYNSGVRANLT